MNYLAEYSKTYPPSRVNRIVARGAKWLDKHCPGWELDIDVKALNLAKPDVCILGQSAHCVTKGAVASRHWDAYSQALHIVVPDSAYAGGDDAEEGWSRSHGFNIQSPPSTFFSFSGESAARYEMLTIAWVAEIRKRGAVK